MKISLILILSIVSTLAFGQKKLAAIAETQFDETGNIVQSDSLVYVYNTIQGSVNELKPKFGFDGTLLRYFIDYDNALLIPCDTIQQFILQERSH